MIDSESWKSCLHRTVIIMLLACTALRAIYCTLYYAPDRTVLVLLCGGARCSGSTVCLHFGSHTDCTATYPLYCCSVLAHCCTFYSTTDTQFIRSLSWTVPRAFYDPYLEVPSLFCPHVVFRIVRDFVLLCVSTLVCAPLRELCFICQLSTRFLCAFHTIYPTMFAPSLLVVFPSALPLGRVRAEMTSTVWELLVTLLATTLILLSNLRAYAL